MCFSTHQHTMCDGKKYMTLVNIFLRLFLFYHIWHLNHVAIWTTQIARKCYRRKVFFLVRSYFFGTFCEKIHVFDDFCLGAKKNNTRHEKKLSFHNKIFNLPWPTNSAIAWLLQFYIEKALGIWKILKIQNIYMYFDFLA